MTTILECMSQSRNEDVGRFLNNKNFLCQKIKIRWRGREGLSRDAKWAQRSWFSNFCWKTKHSYFLMDSMAEQYGRVANKMTKKHGTKYNDTSIRAESKMWN